jgi:2'-5' RNA ligase
MRLFVAVELSDQVRDAVERAAAEMRSRLGSRVDARWVTGEKLHVTVRFIGQVEDQRAAEVIRAVSPPISIPAFEILLDRCGVFPRSGPARVLWVGLDESGRASLAAIHDEIDRCLQPLGFEPERRPFSAHLTVARVREIARAANADVRKIVSDCRPEPARCRVSHATLFRSHLSPKGSRYEALARIDLLP